ncbi:MAG: LysR substrate-binding domain-containing protein [Pigmentiphaga sp.]|uniref:LysR substrate-binding domain-containing protein n=1 Tax=Pigmentiphaga sp. TaxID=1977564 RepID=UPI0029A8EBA1|nr:LysR substrate-binding domain-containing protein [Pigmentiphaga sp.]MDX3906221.1 LysR substrate-binding domain-containing protein [Pigmentiphaga sp.]
MSNLVRKLDLTSLRLFVAVCQERNIARAAEREAIAPSAVSRRIAEIEGLIGLPVIHRESRGISVTPIGEAVLRHAQEVLADIERLEAELSQYATGAKGTLRIVGNMSSTVQFLPEDIAAFKRVFPDVDIQIDEQTSSQVLRSLVESDFDLGFCNPVPGIEQLEHLPYRSDRLYLAVPRHHRLARATVVRLGDFMDENIVGMGQGTSLTQLLVREAGRRGASLHVKISVSSLDALCRMVHVGLGVAVVPQHSGELYVNTLDLALIPIEEPWAIRELVIVFRQRDRLTAPAAALVNFLASR